MNGKRAKALRNQAKLYIDVKKLKEIQVPGKRQTKAVKNKDGKLLGFRFKIGKSELSEDPKMILKYTYKALKSYYKRNFVHG